MPISFIGAGGRGPRLATSRGRVWTAPRLPARTRSARTRSLDPRNRCSWSTTPRRDERFHDNPLRHRRRWTSAFTPASRCSRRKVYALGTFCIADRVGHTLQRPAACRPARPRQDGRGRTDHRRTQPGARHRLRAAEENYRGIFENVAEGIFQVDCEGRYLNANPAAARALRLRLGGRFHGGPCSDFGRAQQVHPDRRDDMLQPAAHRTAA